VIPGHHLHGRQELPQLVGMLRPPGGVLLEVDRLTPAEPVRDLLAQARQLALRAGSGRIALGWSHRSRSLLPRFGIEQFPQLFQRAKVTHPRRIGRDVQHFAASARLRSST
jgi:hypothetical protein